MAATELGINIEIDCGGLIDFIWDKPGLCWRPVIWKSMCHYILVSPGDTFDDDGNFVLTQAQELGTMKRCEEDLAGSPCILTGDHWWHQDAKGNAWARSLAVELRKDFRRKFEERYGKKK